MELNTAFGQALKQVRNSKRLTQEDFSSVSSRTYLSTLERGLKSPTLEKVDQLSEVLEVHPLTILVATYLGKESYLDVESLLKKVSDELRLISQSRRAP